MAQLFYAGHEANDFSEWDFKTGAGLTTNAGAALGGSSFGVEITPATSGSGFARWSPAVTPASGFVRFGARLDKNNVSLSAGTTARIMAQTYNDLLYVFFKEDGGTLKIYIETDEDDTTLRTATSISTFTAGEHTIEARIVQAATDISADGAVYVYVDGVEFVSITGLDNFDNFDNSHLGNYTIQNFTSGGTPTGTWYIDEFYVRDDDVSVFSNYSYVQSSGGLAKPALAVSQDGDNVFIALEDDATGNQIIFKATRPSSPTVSAVYEPGAGSAANVIATGDPDKMVFFGNFGTGLGVLMHTISTDAESDISPTSIGADKIQPLAIDPSDINHIVAVNVTDQDALESEDGGAAWSTLNAALGQTPVAMGIMFFGALFPFGAFVGGNDGVDENLTYTPNEFSNLREDTSAALKAVGGITGIDLVTG